MATDQVPKFIRTERFLELLATQQNEEARSSGTGNAVGGTTAGGSSLTEKSSLSVPGSPLAS